MGEGGVPACGGVGQVEHQGEVQRVGTGGQRFVQYPVAADAVEPDARQETLVEVGVADRAESVGAVAGRSLGCFRANHRFRHVVPVQSCAPAGSAYVRAGASSRGGRR